MHINYLELESQSPPSPPTHTRINSTFRNYFELKDYATPLRFESDQTPDLQIIQDNFASLTFNAINDKGYKEGKPILFPSHCYKQPFNALHTAYSSPNPPRRLPLTLPAYDLRFPFLQHIISPLFFRYIGYIALFYPEISPCPELRLVYISDYPFVKQHIFSTHTHLVIM